MVPFLGFNLAETALAWPPQGRGQAQQKPSLAKAPKVEAECEENPAQGKTRGPACWKLREQKQTQQKAHVAQSQIPEDLQLRLEVLNHMAGGTYPNKILIPLQSLISCFLEPPMNR